MRRIVLSRGLRAGGALGFGGCGCGAIIAVLVLAFIAGILALIFGIMRSSEPFQQAVAEVQHNPQAVRALGEPIKIGWFLSGSISTSGDSGEAELSIPVSGPVDKGTLYVEAYKSEDVWHFTRMELVTKKYPNRINLLEE